MISALEIGFALSSASLLLVLAHALTQPRPKAVPIRVRDAGRRRRPDA